MLSAASPKTNGGLFELPSDAPYDKKTLFLDLDDTLVKVVRQTGKEEDLHVLTPGGDFSFELKQNCLTERYTVFKRNGLDDFLKFAA